MLADITAVVSRYYGVAEVDIRGGRRMAGFIFPRHAAFYLATRRFEFSTPTVGAWFGGRDHTSVLHARDKLDALIAAEPELGALMDQFEIASIAHARLRQQGLVRFSAEVNPARVAARVVAGGHRAALGVSVDEITAMAEALSRLGETTEEELSNV
jgi:hypothetical protein